jgi:putative sterol carrier protein
MDIRSPREFFDEVLPKRFNPAKAAGVDVIVQLSITGPEGGDWIVAIKDQKIEIKEGIHPSPTLSLKMREKDYLDMINHKLSAENAFMTGKLQFKGNIILAMKLRDLGFL